MSESEEKGGSRKSEATVDPRDDQTQPFILPDTDERNRDLATTTWAGQQAPPMLVEEPTEPSVAIPEDRPDEATIVAPVEDPVSAPTPTPTPTPAPEPEAEPEPEFEITETESIGDDASDAATVVAAAMEVSTRSMLAPSSSLHPMLLERIEPSLGRGERIRLDAAHWRVRLGRAENNDIQLYTASASREHAVVAGNEAGEWVVTPAEGKSVLIDGEETFEPVVLEVGMNLVMGGDQLRCVTEGLKRSEMSAQTAADGLADKTANAAKGSFGRVSLSWWLIGGIAVIGVGLILYAWFAG